MRGNHANEKEVKEYTSAREGSEKQGVSVSGLTPPRPLLAVISHCKLANSHKTAASIYEMEIRG